MAAQTSTRTDTSGPAGRVCFGVNCSDWVRSSDDTSIFSDPVRNSTPCGRRVVVVNRTAMQVSLLSVLIDV